MFIRIFYYHILIWIDKEDWNEEIIKDVNDILWNDVFYSKDTSVGIKLHLLDIFWDEFKKIQNVINDTLIGCKIIIF